MDESQNLADRYVDVWNETDQEQRRIRIAELWVPDGVHYVATFKATGYDELEQRVFRSHQKNVVNGKFRFRAIKNASKLHDVVTFNWEMIAATGEVSAAGLEFLIIDDSSRILIDYQFILN